MIYVKIPGPPKPQGRGRIVQVGRKPTIADPKDSREWKGAAQWQMKLECPTPLIGPLSVRILDVFACPIGDYRKRSRRPRRWHDKAGGDIDNLAKAVLDAGNGVLWVDDRQVAELFVQKVVAAQDEAPSVRLSVRVLEEGPPNEVPEVDSG